MFELSLSDISRILKEYGISEHAAAFDELQRYNYDEKGSASKEVRLIIKVRFDGRPPVVMRFRNETDVTEELVEAQCRFAFLLLENGIESPYLYSSGGAFARTYPINGYEVIVTAEDFCEGEVKAVDEATARMTGRLLAEMHNISERKKVPSAARSVKANSAQPNRTAAIT